MFLFYYFFLAIVWLISILPFRIIYIISDFFSFILHYILGYRKNVIFTNLKNAFPEKEEKEIKKIVKKYYRNLSDIFLEVLKIKGMSRDELAKRVTFKNYEIFNELYKSRKSVLIAMGHCGNWEYISMALAMKSKHKVYAVVKPLSDKFFDRFMINTRSKFNKDCLILFNETTRTLIKNRSKLTANILISDQTPTKTEINYWTNFLNQDTPFFLGVEKIAKSFDFTVVFFNIQRIKRGFYEVEIIKITDTPKQTSEFEITENHIHLLEKAINEHPDNWLWSHRRWKHKRD